VPSRAWRETAAAGPVTLLENMKPKIVIIDYGMGNLRSVQKAFEVSGVNPKVTSSRFDIGKADKIILPGVGAFSQAMHELKKNGLIEVLKDKICSGTPYLGLCLGLQILFSSSEEGSAKGLGLLPGKVKKFNGNEKVPHMGWNTLSLKKRNCPLMKGVSKKDFFYFVHSFYAVPEDKNTILSTTDYGINFCSSIWQDNIFATQFHPEKSQQAGLRIIGNFIAC